MLINRKTISFYNKPMMDLLYEAATIVREQHAIQTWFRFQPYYLSKQLAAQKIAVIACK
jgi:hypothetical protein